MVFIKYFYIVPFLVFFAGAVWLFWSFLRRMKKDFALRTLARKILTQQKNISRPVYFSTSELKKHLLKNSDEMSIDEYCSTLFFHPENALKTLKKAAKKNNERLILEADLCFVLNKKKQARTLSESAPASGLSRFARAKKLFLTAAFALEESDLMAASEDCAKASVLFRKEKAFYEVAETYLLMGTIYRISALYDVAHMMFRNAADIFGQLGADHRKAEALGNLGMLTAAQDLFEDAETYFKDAENIYTSLNRKLSRSEIINQRALTFLAAGTPKKAAALIKQARFKGRGAQYNAFAGLNYELESRTLTAQKKWKQAQNAAETALEFYKKTNNLPGQLETLMLQAQAFFEMQNLKKSETLARQAVKLAEKQSSCFHIANAFSLLGLIFLQQGDLSRAKTFFMQSLSQETRNNRRSGMAIDCANLSLLEKLSGHSDEADNFAQKALEYAQTYGEDELCRLLTNKN